VEKWQKSGSGAGCALELIGFPATMQQAVQLLAISDRVGIVGLSDKLFTIVPYTDLFNKEVEMIGVSDQQCVRLPGCVWGGHFPGSVLRINVIICCYA
jgi:threonine dehydrogenase-like Zn-dependent dehydrogenase